METLWQDLRYSGRMLVKHPGFTLIALLTLSLGIGANTAIFSIVNAVLLRPFPYRAPEQFVMVGEGISRGSVSYPNFVDWKDDRNVFESTSAVRSNESFNFTGAGEPERLQGRLVSAGFLSLLGINPLLGRDFIVDDDRPEATPAVILSYGFWGRRVASDQSVIGNRSPLTIRATPLLVLRRRIFSLGRIQTSPFPSVFKRNALRHAAQIRESTSLRVCCRTCRRSRRRQS